MKHIIFSKISIYMFLVIRRIFSFVFAIIMCIYHILLALWDFELFKLKMCIKWTIRVPFFGCIRSYQIVSRNYRVKKNGWQYNVSVEEAIAKAKTGYRWVTHESELFFDPWDFDSHYVQWLKLKPNGEIIDTISCNNIDPLLEGDLETYFQNLPEKLKAAGYHPNQYLMTTAYVRKIKNV